MALRNEIKALTGLRGVAALYVVFHHYWIGLSMINPLSTFVAHGYLSVDLFFILSGFVMALNYSHLFQTRWTWTSYFTFLGRRIARVYPLYLAATLVGCVFVMAGWLEGPAIKGMAATMLTNLLMIQSWNFGVSLDGPAWSISAEWAAYLIFPLLLVPSYLRNTTAAVVTAGVCIGSLTILALTPAHMLHNTRPLFVLDLHNSYLAIPVLRCLFEFTLGLLCFRFTLSATALRVRKMRWLCAAISLVILLLLTIPRADLAAVLAFPVLIIALSAGDQLPHRILSSSLAQLAGLLSYSIYLVHGLLTGLVGWIHRLASANAHSHGQTYGAVACAVLTLPLAWLAYNYIEYPGRHLLRHLFERSHRARIAIPTIR